MPSMVYWALKKKKKKKKNPFHSIRYSPFSSRHLCELWLTWSPLRAPKDFDRVRFLRSKIVPFRWSWLLHHLSSRARVCCVHAYVRVFCHIIYHKVKLTWQTFHRLDLPRKSFCPAPRPTTPRLRRRPRPHSLSLWRKCLVMKRSDVPMASQQLSTSHADPFRLLLCVVMVQHVEACPSPLLCASTTTSTSKNKKQKQTKKPKKLPPCFSVPPPPTPMALFCALASLCVCLCLSLSLSLLVCLFLSLCLYDLR